MNAERREADGTGRLSGRDLRRLGALHVECIGDSLPGLLGPRFGAHLYGLFERSATEHVLYERVDAAIEAAVVVSESPADLQRRIVRALLPQLAAAAAVALVSRPAFWRFVWGGVADAVRGRAHTEHAPEITYVFTSPQIRGRGLGKRLVERVDRLLASRGADVYYVKTIDEPTNRTLAFYEREGFERIGTRDEAGRHFVEFRKRLDAR
jgi:GNAT superfamily N-acetyltransferase